MGIVKVYRIYSVSIARMIFCGSKFMASSDALHYTNMSFSRLKLSVCGGKALCTCFACVLYL